MFEYDKVSGKSVVGVFKTPNPKVEQPGKAEALKVAMQSAWDSQVLLKKQKPKDILCPTTIGVEVEIEKVSEHTPFMSHLMKPTNDGSLKDNGIELVSVVLPGDLVGHFLTELEVWLSRNPHSIFSHRCSIHIHLGVQQMTLEQVVTLITLYVALEDIIFSLFPQRRDNAYCFPMAHTGFTLHEFEKNQMDPKVYKYCALNVYHLRDYCTLEFRHSPGTKNMDRLAYWINIICCLYAYARDHNLEFLIDTLKQLNVTSEYELFVRSVFGDKTPDPLILDRRMMRNAILSAKHFLGEEF